jgi:hypothetical protein
MVAKYLVEFNEKISISKIYKSSDGWTVDQIYEKIKG